MIDVESIILADDRLENKPEIVEQVRDCCGFV